MIDKDPTELQDEADTALKDELWEESHEVKDYIDDPDTQVIDVDDPFHKLLNLKEIGDILRRNSPSLLFIYSSLVFSIFRNSGKVYVNKNFDHSDMIEDPYYQQFVEERFGVTREDFNSPIEEHWYGALRRIVIPLDSRVCDLMIESAEKSGKYLPIHVEDEVIFEMYGVGQKVIE